MQKIGDMWVDGLKDSVHAFDLEQNMKSLDASISMKEEKTENFCQELKSRFKDLVVSTLSRGSNSLSVHFPDYTLGTQALGDFSSWVAEQSMLMTFLKVDHPDAPLLDQHLAEGYVLVNFVPLSTTSDHRLCA